MASLHVLIAPKNGSGKHELSNRPNNYYFPVDENDRSSISYNIYITNKWANISDADNKFYGSSIDLDCDRSARELARV